MKKSTLKFTVILLIVLIIMLTYHIDVVASATLHGISACVYTIIPSLFLFLVVSNVAIAFIENCDENISVKFLLMFFAAVCGFPCGALFCESLYNIKRIDLDTAKRLIPLCNNASPAFIIGAVGASMMQSKRIGILIYVSQLIVSAVAITFSKIRISKIFTKERKNKNQIFFSSVEKSLEGILKICGMICVFYVVLALADIYFSDTAIRIIASVFEIGNGNLKCSELFHVFPALSVGMCAFSCGWSGVCVHMQIFSSVKNIKIGYIQFALKKAAIGISSATLSVIGYYLFFT